MKLESVPKGFRDIYNGVADEEIENPQIVAVRGDSTQSVKLLDSKTVELTVNGDGAVGPDDLPTSNAFQVTVDGAIGEREVVIVSDFEYNVVSKDATVVSFTKVRREPLPA